MNNTNTGTPPNTRSSTVNQTAEHTASQKHLPSIIAMAETAEQRAPATIKTNTLKTDTHTHTRPSKGQQTNKTATSDT